MYTFFMNQALAVKLNDKLKGLSPEEILSFFLKDFDGEIGFSTSLGAEDQVITHMIADIDKSTPIFTLDTGRLFQETYELLYITENKYNIKITVYFPHSKQVEKMVNENGINLFYESVEKRKHCCFIRKTEPLKRAMHDLDAWICGLRRDQLASRQNSTIVEWDELHNILKINPLIYWTEKQVWDYIKNNNIPYNRLHDKGFPSIGCQPCTRAIKSGEGIRAGRWWWEMEGHKECGLHQSPT